MALVAALVTEIVELIANPSPAVPEAQVNVKVRVKNLGLAPGGYNYLAVTGVFDSAELFFAPDYQYSDPQAIVEFNASFTMPSQKTRVTVYSFYWDFSTGTWKLDDQRYIDIEVTGVVPVGWVKLDTKYITLSPLEEVVPPTGWVKLGTRTITLMPTEEVPPPEGWVKLDTRTITLTPTEAPPIIPPPPPEEKKFPWVPVLIGGGALIATIGILVARKRK